MNTITERWQRWSRQHPQLAKPLKAPGRKLWHALHSRENRTVERLFTQLAAQLTEDPCIEVPEFHGRFYLDARSALFRRLVRDGGYEPALTALCLQHAQPERDVLDVGANIGFHAVLFARHLSSGRVLSVEPTRLAFERLQRNLLLNEVHERVIAHHGAVADSTGELRIKTVAGREEFSTLGELAHPAIAGAAYAEESTSASTIDELVARHQLDIGFMKVDVEGAEHLVFRGASDVLSTHRPAIIAELSNTLLTRNGSSASEVIELIQAFDYVISDPLRPGELPGTQDFGDILCVPR